MAWPSKRRSYSGQILKFDSATYQGKLRNFGIINPINFALLSDFISVNWKNISDIYSMSKCSGNRPKFPKTTSANGRAIESTTISSKRRSQKHLASSFPLVLDLDISRFYESVYTHSIPWAALGKQSAKALFKSKRLKSNWSDEFDHLIRNCNSQQTIGIPIGPDTSRIISEMILSRIDRELCLAKSGIVSNQIFHNIDDYQFGVLDRHTAESAQSLFVRIIREYELRLNDFKTKTSEGLQFSPSNWQREFDQLSNFKASALIERFFDLIYRLTSEHPNSNVVGYSLKRFGKNLIHTQEYELLTEYLQRLIFAAPYMVRWVAPIYLGIMTKIGVTAECKRMIDWCIETCARRNDAGSVIWLLYCKIYLQLKVSKNLAEACFNLNCPLIDLQIFHLKNISLCNFSSNKLRERYDSEIFDSKSWITLYEVEKRKWDTDPAFTKFGTNSDEGSMYSSLANSDVHFYQSENQYFSPEAFDGWNLKQETFSEKDEFSFEKFIAAIDYERDDYDYFSDIYG